MKVIITGSTGLIGGAILRCAIKDPAVTSIVALARRELAEDVSKEEKVKTVIIKDFGVYSEDTIAALQGAEACIWAIGGRATQFPDAKSAHLANVDYLHAAAKVFAEKLAPALNGKKFHFVYCSGAMAERNTEQKLYFMAASRTLKGEAENGLLEIEKAHPDSFAVYIGRPGGVLETDSGIQNTLFGPMGIGKGYLAHAMVDMAVHGATKQLFESKELRSKGAGLAAKAANS